jgi:hypothetical protein
MAGSPATRQFALELYTLPLSRQQTGVFLKSAPFSRAIFFEHLYKIDFQPCVQFYLIKLQAKAECMDWYQ